MKSSNFLSVCLSLCTAVAANPLSQSNHGIVRKADPNLVGYLGAFFLGEEPDVFFHLSDGNNPLSFRPLNDGQPVIVPTMGTGGVRDPTIVPGGGEEAGTKWYIIGTDLDIAKTNWDDASRRGSLSIFIWESTDLVNWTDERLVKVEEDTAGMVWAPEAIWDEETGQYLVHWASTSFPASDPTHSGEPSVSRMRYAYTSDFRTFSAPETYIDYDPTSLIDLNFLPLGNNSYARFLKDESVKTVFTEITDGGLFGTWTRVPQDNEVIEEGVEGPWGFWDNEVEGKAYLLLDFYDGDGYYPLESTDVSGGVWTRSDAPDFPGGLRHGSVIGVDQSTYDALNEL